MNETKPATQSLTIRSVVGTLIVVAYQLIGVGFFGLPELPETIFEVLVSLGLVTAGYGRFRATTKLK